MSPLLSFPPGSIRPSNKWKKQRYFHFQHASISPIDGNLTVCARHPARRDDWSDPARSRHATSPEALTVAQLIICFVISRSFTTHERDLVLMFPFYEASSRLHTGFCTALTAVPQHDSKTVHTYHNTSNHSPSFKPHIGKSKSASASSQNSGVGQSK